MWGGSASSNLVSKAKEVLQSAWEEISRIPPAELDTTVFVEDPEIETKIRQLTSARTKAFRYALLTQILAKAAEPSINCCVLQAGAQISGAFDARSLCREVVVPFERTYLSNALGGSGDPYVSKPLRRPRITDDPEVTREIKNKEEWNLLYKLLHCIEVTHDPSFTQQVLKQALLELRKAILQEALDLPEGICIEQLRDILSVYLARTTLGMGPQAVAYALLDVFNKRTQTYANVTTAPPTAPDAPAGRAADIECRDKDQALRLAICVTQKLDLEKLEAELRKCKEHEAATVLFLTCETDVTQDDLRKKAAQHRINAAVCQVVDFVVIVTVLLNREMRKQVIHRISAVLREWGGVNAVREFNEVLREKLTK